MAGDGAEDWRLILEGARAMTAAGQSPFTRVSVYELPPAPARGRVGAVFLDEDEVKQGAEEGAIVFERPSRNGRRTDLWVGETHDPAIEVK